MTSAEHKPRYMNLVDDYIRRRSDPPLPMPTMPCGHPLGARKIVVTTTAGQRPMMFTDCWACEVESEIGVAKP